MGHEFWLTEMNMRQQFGLTIAFSILGTCALGLATADRLGAAETVTTVNVTKQNAPPPPASPAAAATCEAAWMAADLNKNGVLDPDEALVYAAALNVQHKPPVTDTNLNKAGFLKDCETLTAHE